MNVLLKKAYRKKQRRNRHIRSIEPVDITRIFKQDLITKLNDKTELNTNFYNNSNIISNIDDFTYKSLDYVLEKYE